MPPEARGRLVFQPLAGYEPEVGRAMWPVEDALTARFIRRFT